MKEADVYNNGNGWRISFEFQGKVRVLTVPETRELRTMLQVALLKVPILVKEEYEHKRNNRKAS